MKDHKGPTTQATMFLKANGVAFTDHLYAYEEHGGRAYLPESLALMSMPSLKRSLWKTS